MRQWVPGWQPIFRTLGSLIKDPLFVTGEQSIEYQRVAVLRKQRQTCVLVDPCWIPTVCGYTLPQLERLSYAVQMKFYCFIRQLEAFTKLSIHLAAVLFYVPFRNSSSKTFGRLLWGSSYRTNLPT